MFERLQSERDSLRLLVAIRRRWWLIALVAIIAGGSAYVLAKRQEKQYSATASLLFRDPDFSQILFGNQVYDTPDPTRAAATNQSLVEVPTVAMLVGRQLHMTTASVQSEVSFGSDATSDVVGITATDPTPARAAAIANAYVDQYIKFSTTADRSQLSQAEQTIGSQLAAIPASQRGTPTAQGLISRRNELALLVSLQAGGAEVVQTATPPEAPSAPTPTKDGIIGMVLGLLAGLALVAVLQARDRRIKSPQEVEELYGVPVIGSVPMTRTLRGGAVGTRSEQDIFRMLLARWRYLDVDRESQRVTVASHVTSAVTSTTAPSPPARRGDPELRDTQNGHPREAR